ncbi:MAG: hypothetical protein KKH75_01645, partial [Actinobacteria bacterium]|nr:hypothetical protein [Actinomycetota bacterium]
MALFSRRPQRPNATEPHAPEPAAVPEVTAPQATAPEAPAPEPEVAPQVGISMSSFGGLGPATTDTSEPQVVGTVERPSEEAPPAAETIPGLRDNVLLRDALAALTDASDGQKL